MTTNKEDNYKFGFGVWLTLCLVLCAWFLSSFIKGRRQFQTNLHVIEEGLRRMQEEMELKQRQGSISYGEDMQELADFIKNLNNTESDKEKQEDAQLTESCGEIQDELQFQPEEVGDKKNV